MTVSRRRRLGPQVGAVQGRALQHPDHQAGLSRGELEGRLAEIEQGRGLHAPDVAAEGRLIQIVLQNLFLRHHPFQLHGLNELPDLGPQAAGPPRRDRRATFGRLPPGRLPL